MSKLLSLLVVMIVGCGGAFTNALEFGDDAGGDAGEVFDDSAPVPDADASGDVALVDAAGDVQNADAADAAAFADASPTVDAAPFDASPDTSPPDAGLCCNTERCGVGGEMFVCGSSQHVCEQGCQVGDFCAYLGIASTVTPCP
jgi:hypothetical protein